MSICFHLIILMITKHFLTRNSAVISCFAVILPYLLSFLKILILRVKIFRNTFWAYEPLWYGLEKWLYTVDSVRLWRTVCLPAGLGFYVLPSCTPNQQEFERNKHCGGSLNFSLLLSFFTTGNLTSVKPNLTWECPFNTILCKNLRH